MTLAGEDCRVCELLGLHVKSSPPPLPQKGNTPNKKLINKNKGRRGKILSFVFCMIRAMALPSNGPEHPFPGDFGETAIMSLLGQSDPPRQGRFDPLNPMCSRP